MNIAMMDYIRTICLVLGYVSVKVASIDLALTNKACDGNSMLGSSNYAPLSLQECLTDEEIMSSAKGELPYDRTARISDYAVSSPTYTFAGCAKLSNILDLNTINAKTFTNQQKAVFVYNCFRSCASVPTDTENLYVGLSDKTCYCVQNFSVELRVENKYCGEHQPDYTNYVSVFNTSVGYKYLDVAKYATYFQLCQYVTISTYGVPYFLYGLCSLPVDGVACGTPLHGRLENCSSTISAKLCIVQQQPMNMSHARYLCGEQYGTLESSLNFEDNYKRYDSLSDTQYLLSGCRDLFVFNHEDKGTECITLIHKAGNLFVGTSNCKKDTQYMCKKSLGPFWYVFICILGGMVLCVALVSSVIRYAQFRGCSLSRAIRQWRRNKSHTYRQRQLGNNVKFDAMNMQKQTDTASDNSSNCLPNAITGGFDVGRMSSDGSVPGPTNNSVASVTVCGSVPGPTNNSIPRVTDGGCVPGRI